MKKIILILSLASLAFSCSSDDDSGSDETCVTCEVLGFETTICDNGDGTVTQEVLGESETVDIPEGTTFEEFSTCPDFDIDLF